MSTPTLEQLKYPTGKFQWPTEMDLNRVKHDIEQIKTLPYRLREIVESIPEEGLDKPYRPDGWTVRQLVHHITDSHINSYVRFKWTLTEDNPTIKTYYQDGWASLPEAKSAPVGISLDLLEALHRRWGLVLDNLTSENLQRTFTTPRDRKIYYLMAAG